MKKTILITCIGVLLTAGVRAQELKKTPSGASYKIVTPGNGQQIKLNDVITFNYEQRTPKDSLLGKSTQPVKIPVTPSRHIADLMDVFLQLSAKDSAVVYVPTDSIFKGYEQQRPPFLPAGSSLAFILKILNVQTEAQAIEEGNRLMDSLRSLEQPTLTAYLGSQTPAYTTTTSGLIYGITTPSLKAKPAKGDTLLVNYVGATLDGKVFDTSIQAEALKAGLDQPGRPYEPIKLTVGNGEVIPGWDEGLLLFNEGAKGFLIIPSTLAYGEQGGGEVIKPFSTLRFDIEVVKVIKPKPVAVKKPVPVVKKTTTAPVKKTTTTTPAKKVTTPAKKTTTTAKPAVKKN